MCPIRRAFCVIPAQLAAGSSHVETIPYSGAVRVRGVCLAAHLSEFCRATKLTGRTEMAVHAILNLVVTGLEWFIRLQELPRLIESAKLYQGILQHIDVAHHL